MVLTEMTRALAEESRQRGLDETLLKRLSPSRGHRRGGAVPPLSDAARMITGEVIRVGAGQYI